jgi:hypothetical protein
MTTEVFFVESAIEVCGSVSVSVSAMQLQVLQKSMTFAPEADAGDSG